MDLYQIIQTIAMFLALGALYGKLTEKIKHIESMLDDKTKRIEKIETQLGNHITHIAADIKDIFKETTSIRERLSNIEGRID